MYIPKQFMCLSFSGPSKILKLGKGGAILTIMRKQPNGLKSQVSWQKPNRSRKDNFDMLGWNMYMTPETSARGLVLMQGMEDNEDVTQEYQDLSKFDVYK